MRVAPNSTSGIRRFRELVTDAYRRFNVLERAEKGCFGVTMSQCMTLELLLDNGRLAVGALAEALGLETSTVTRTVDVLVRDGLLHRVRDESVDRRRVFVSLTDAGRKLAVDLQRCADDYCARILERVPAERRDDLGEALALLVGALDDLPTSSTG